MHLAKVPSWCTFNVNKEKMCDTALMVLEVLLIHSMQTVVEAGVPQVWNTSLPYIAMVCITVALVLRTCLCWKLVSIADSFSPCRMISFEPN